MRLSWAPVSRKLIAASVAALIAATAACHRNKDPDEAPAPLIRGPVPLTVVNKAGDDLTVFVQHDGRAERLERVPSVRTITLVIPARMIGTLGEVRLIGERPGTRAGFARRIVSQTVLLQPCQRLEWTIEARGEQSVLAVYYDEACAG